MITFHILGPVEIHPNGRVLDIPDAEQRLIVGLLVLHANRPVPVRRVVKRLWGASAPPGAEQAVRHQLCMLEQALGSRLRSWGASSHVLQASPGSIDLCHFIALRKLGHLAMVRGEARTAANLLRDAAALWRGPAVAEAAWRGLLWPELAGLEDLRLRGLEDRLEADLRLNSHEAVVHELEMLAAQNPLRGRLHGLLIVALTRCGRHADAINAYERALQCAQEHGRHDAGVFLNGLRQTVLRLDFPRRARSDLPARPLLTAGCPAASTASVAAERPVPQRLPRAGVTKTRPAERSLIDVARHLNRVSPVTIVGSPESSRTKLALATAHLVDGHFADGIAVASLREATSAADVISAIAAALDVVQRPGQALAVSVTSHVAHREMLLILKDADTVPETVQIIDQLLAAAAGLAVLATGSRRLGVRGERVYPAAPQHRL